MKRTNLTKNASPSLCLLYRLKNTKFNQLCSETNWLRTFEFQFSAKLHLAYSSSGKKATAKSFCQNDNFALAQFSASRSADAVPFRSHIVFVQFFMFLCVHTHTHTLPIEFTHYFSRRTAYRMCHVIRSSVCLQEQPFSRPTFRFYNTFKFI